MTETATNYPAALAKAQALIEELEGMLKEQTQHTANALGDLFIFNQRIAHFEKVLKANEKELSRYTRMSESGETLGDALDMCEELSRLRPVVEAARDHYQYSRRHKESVYTYLKTKAVKSCCCSICEAIRKLDGGE